MKPFDREKFLLYMLAGIFIWQAGIFTYGVIGCFRIGGKAACPELGERYEATVNVMVATTLALLGAGAVASATQRKASASDRDEASVLQRPEQPLPPPEPSPLPDRSPRPKSPSEGKVPRASLEGKDPKA